MIIQFSRRGMAAQLARLLKARSSLVRSLVRAHDDPGKQRMRAWLRELDDEQLTSLDLTPTSSFCTTELSALLRKLAPSGAGMFDGNNSLPLSLFLQAERQARVDSLVIKACMRGTMSRLAEWLSALGTWGTRLAYNLADEWLLRCVIRELHQLDDRTLADIGITRCGIDYAVRHGRPHA